MSHIDIHDNSIDIFHSKTDILGAEVQNNTTILFDISNAWGENADITLTEAEAGALFFWLFGVLEGFNAIKEAVENV